ncbi:hypothetical protein NDU88_005926 [Pleurodeles waltl]|uniref:Uncharacterized protein n=1 Tax=Pleurodeles waltl TaxID=8319 RepID=A0AAV7MAS2_PLEWA|nr:hypothetical protein NDU88_005926 [Pleurodeles waltl]
MKAAPPVRRPCGVTARHPVRLPLFRVSLHDSKNVSRRSAREPPPHHAGEGCSRSGSGPGQPRRRRSLREEPRESSKPSARSTGQGTWQRGGGGGLGPTCTPAVRPPGSRVPGLKAGGPSRASRPGLAHPPALVGWSHGSLAGPGSSSPRPPCRPRTAGLSGVVQAQGGTSIRFSPPRVVPGGRGFRLGRGLTFPPCRSRRVRSRGGARAPLLLPGPSLARWSGPPGRRSPHPRPVLSPGCPGGRGPLRQPGMRQGEGWALCLGVLRSGRQPRAFGLAPWVARAAPPLMILPQVHLRKPCYDFYFL